MTSFPLMYFLMGLGSLFLFILAIMLLHPKWRKGLFSPSPETTRRSKLTHLADGIELIFTPIIWVIKIIIGIFKSQSIALNSTSNANKASKLY